MRKIKYEYLINLDGKLDAKSNGNGKMQNRNWNCHKETDIILRKKCCTVPFS